MAQLSYTEDGYRSAVVAWARKHVGYTEGPRNSTRFWRTLDKIPGATSGNYDRLNAPWCAGFGVLGLYEASGGVVKLWDAIGLGAYYTPSIAAYAVKRKITKPVSQAKPGDIYLYDFPGGASVDHYGIAWPNPRTSTIRAIEGNTSSGSSGSQSNGGGVFVRHRPAAQIRYCIDLIGLVKAMGHTFAAVNGAPAVGAPAKPAAARALEVDGKLGPATVKALQTWLQAQGGFDFAKHGGIDGDLGKYTVSALQVVLARHKIPVGKADGDFGPKSARALERFLGVSAANVAGWYPGLVRALQRYLNAQNKVTV